MVYYQYIGQLKLADVQTHKETNLNMVYNAGVLINYATDKESLLSNTFTTSGLYQNLCYKRCVNSFTPYFFPTKPFPQCWPDCSVWISSNPW